MAVRVHHLDCGTLCPWPAQLVNGRGGLFAAARLVCHCLLLETSDGLVLVDTGIGAADVADGGRRLGAAWVRLVRPVLDPEQTAVRQVARLGFSPDDVRHIVPTHLDLDHAGGLPDFPRAAVHVWGPEHAAATAPATRRERLRYVAAHWAHGPRWDLLGPGGERWRGFDAVRALPGVEPEVLLVPLAGHSRGHCGVAVRVADGWLLHCGDAYFFHGEIDPERPHCPAALELFERLGAVDEEARAGNQARLRSLARAAAGEVRLFCAHDPVELDAAAGAAAAASGPRRRRVS
jgi:glyoxylase-like metal-dependent hydrolase (beta-lactamase superfamily II)